ncbi:hypothetical protein [Brevundimonas sp. SORGH_AS_0993]|uniref:hypothetical protein n=1 Tax=Brevundimonas sp. SORGH_AS_0993 TaxID=3041794 RepID=UPI0027D83AF4|nr:hypothetical protein [Brevundimonas sp. SORGH_AS_0993]
MAQAQNTFMPLFRAWLSTTDIAEQLYRAELAGSQDNLLATVDLAPMDEAETTLLGHMPTNPAEAACLLEVVRQNLADAGRSDGLDVQALQAVQGWLAKLALGEAEDDAPVARLLRQASKRG